MCVWEQVEGRARDWHLFKSCMPNLHIFAHSWAEVEVSVGVTHREASLLKPPWCEVVYSESALTYTPLNPASLWIATPSGQWEELSFSSSTHSLSSWPTCYILVAPPNGDDTACTVAFGHAFLIYPLYAYLILCHSVSFQQEFI